MKYLSVFLLLAAFAFSAAVGQNCWNGLKVTYHKDKSDKWAFDRMPLTRVDAEKAGWKQIGGKNASCSGIGYRYSLNDDPAVVLIFAEDGVLVGLQSGVLESTLNSTKLIDWFKQQPMFQVEHPEYNKSETLYTLKAYFSDPDHVCDKDFQYVPEFFFINGTQKVSVPTNESQIQVDSAWVPAKCKPGKGKHYFYKITKDMDCNNFLPFFPMYNKRKLVAFSFVRFGAFHSTSNRYGPFDLHPKKEYKEHFYVVPDCMYQHDNNVITIHAYLTESPWNIDCKD